MRTQNFCLTQTNFQTHFFLLTLRLTIEIKENAFPNWTLLTQVLLDSKVKLAIQNYVSMDLITSRKYETCHELGTAQPQLVFIFKAVFIFEFVFIFQVIFIFKIVFLFKVVFQFEVFIIFNVIFIFEVISIYVWISPATTKICTLFENCYLVFTFIFYPVKKTFWNLLCILFGCVRNQILDLRVKNNLRIGH